MLEKCNVLRLIQSARGIERKQNKEISFDATGTMPLFAKDLFLLNQVNTKANKIKYAAEKNI